MRHRLGMERLLLLLLLLLLQLLLLLLPILSPCCFTRISTQLDDSGHQ